MKTCPIDDYDQMTVGDVESAITPYTNGVEQLSDSDIVQRLDLVTAVLEYEQSHKDRKTAKSTIGEVRDVLRSEARPRGLLTEDEEAEEQEADETRDDEATTDGTDEDADSDSTADEDTDGEETTESVPDADVDSTSGPGPMAQKDREAADASFKGNDRRTRILVKNHRKESRRVAGHGFDGGEVKEIVVNDKLRSAIRRGQLQVVQG